jgi:hypothetical protein
MKPIVIVMKALVAVVFVWMIIMFFGMIDFQIVQLSSINVLIATLRNLINYGFSSFSIYLFQGASLLSDLAFNPAQYVLGIKFYDPNFHISISSMILQEMFRNFSPYFYNIHTDPLQWTTVTYDMYEPLISEDLVTLSGQGYILIFQVLAIFMVLFGVLSVIGNDPKFSIRAVAFLNAMIVIPLFKYLFPLLT